MKALAPLALLLLLGAPLFAEELLEVEEPSLEALSAKELLDCFERALMDEDGDLPYEPDDVLEALSGKGQAALQILPALSRHLYDDPDGTYVTGYIQLLDAIGAPALDEVVRLLGHRSEDARAEALELLESLGEAGDTYSEPRAFPLKDRARVVPALIKTLKDPILGPDAARALGSVGAPALPALLKALDHEQITVRVLAADALRHSGDDPTALVALPKLIALAKCAKNGRLRWASLEAAAAIAVSAPYGSLPADTEEQVAALLARALRPSSPPSRREAAAFASRLLPKPKLLRDALLKSARDTSPALRAAVACALSGEADAIPTLTDLARDPSPRVQRAALDGLANYGAKSAFPVILAALESPHLRVRVAALRAIRSLGTDAVAATPLLLRLLDPQKDSGDRVHVLACLEAISCGSGLSRAVGAKALVLLSSPHCRNVVLRILVRCRYEPAVPRLEALLGKVLARGDRIHVAGALLALRPAHPAALASLRVLHAKGDAFAACTLAERGVDLPQSLATLTRGLGAPLEEQRRKAIWALSRLGSRAAPVAAALERLGRVDPVEEVRIDAVLALTRIAPAVGFPALTKRLASKDPLLRSDAIYQGGQAAPSKARDVFLTAALSDACYGNRLGALHVLGREPKASQVPKLQGLLADPHWLVRRGAARILAKLAPASGAARSRLLQLAKTDPEGDVRDAAALALGALGPATKGESPIRGEARGAQAR
ncbi:MAG: HEAT repeat domain-containing protein [Planctomycetes bacterium]|nr:HEAT repeat domain-containing protein [Planctomycetota bacterium]